ncbi:extracellular solute-binding protein [Virgibacillus kimchii]
MKTQVKILIFMISIAAAVLVLAACGSNNEEETMDSTQEDAALEETDELVVYSARNERFVQDLLDKFSEDTGIEVAALHGADPLQIEAEANNVQADIFISNDLGALGYLHSQGYLAGTDPEDIDTIPEQFRSEDNAYFAISARTRGFIYNKELVSEDDLPKSMEDLFEEEWADVPNGYAITRGGNGGMIGNVSALRHEWGDERTADWISAIQEHAAGIYEGHGDIRRAVGAGEHAFGLVNNYYYHQQLLEPADNNVGFIYPDQGEDEMGAIANAAGIGNVNGGPNEQNAMIFIEWLLEPENQKQFVGESLELLINSDIEVDYPEEVQEQVVNFEDLKIQDMTITDLGEHFEGTKDLIEQSGLDLELR